MTWRVEIITKNSEKKCKNSETEKEKSMNTIEVKINLDPVNDGAIINPERIMKKEEGTLSKRLITYNVLE